MRVSNVVLKLTKPLRYTQFSPLVTKSAAPSFPFLSNLGVGEAKSHPDFIFSFHLHLFTHVQKLWEFSDVAIISIASVPAPSHLHSFGLIAPDSSTATLLHTFLHFPQRSQDILKYESHHTLPTYEHSHSFPLPLNTLQCCITCYTALCHLLTAPPPSFPDITFGVPLMYIEVISLPLSINYAHFTPAYLDLFSTSQWSSDIAWAKLSSHHALVYKTLLLYIIRCFWNVPTHTLIEHILYSLWCY